MIRIKEISPQESYDIRRDVLRENIALTEKMDGDFDVSTIHLGVFKNIELVCVATFMQHDSDHFKGFQYRLRGMATKKRFQHNGFGRIILEEAIKILTSKGVSVLWCNARVIALKFYENSGFKIKGKEFNVHLVGPHFVMYKKLTS